MTDFVMAVRLRRVKLINEGELADHQLSLKNTMTEDGTPGAKDVEENLLSAYVGLDDDLSLERKDILEGS